MFWAAFLCGEEYYTISANFVTEEKIFEVLIRYNEPEFSGYTVYVFYTGDNELKLMLRNFGTWNF